MISSNYHIMNLQMTFEALSLCKQNSPMYVDLLVYDWKLETILNFNYCDPHPQKLETTNP